MAKRLVVTLFKGWAKFAAATDPEKFRSAMVREMKKATEENCEDVRGAIKKEIKSQNFDKNAGLTVLFKSHSTILKGGNMGIGSEMGGGTDRGGALLKSLKHTLNGAFEGFIGVVKNRGGANIALILHEGTTLKMTEKRRKWLAMAIKSAMTKQGMDPSNKGAGHSVGGGTASKTGGASNNVGSVIVIPARKFIVNAMQNPALHRRVIERWAQAAERALKKP